MGDRAPADRRGRPMRWGAPERRMIDAFFRRGPTHPRGIDPTQMASAAYMRDLCDQDDLFRRHNQRNFNQNARHRVRELVVEQEANGNCRRNFPNPNEGGNADDDDGGDDDDDDDEDGGDDNREYCCMIECLQLLTLTLLFASLSCNKVLLLRNLEMRIVKKRPIKLGTIGAKKVENLFQGLRVNVDDEMSLPHVVWQWREGVSERVRETHTNQALNRLSIDVCLLGPTALDDVEIEVLQDGRVCKSKSSCLALS